MASFFKESAVMSNLRLTRSTASARPAELERKWYLVDAEGQVLGRLASHVATLLRGKHKAIYTPNIDTGDFVVVVNAEKVLVKGAKAEKKVYRRHTGYPGGLREIPYSEMLARHPERVIHLAVKGMLPHNKLGRAMLKKLKVYAGPDHPHQAQKPEKIEIQER